MAAIRAVTVAEFVSVLASATAKRFAGLCGVTVPKLTVKDRVSKEPWAVLFPSIDRANVRKVTHAVVMAGPDFVSMVMNELAREGKDASQATFADNWHEAVPGMPLLRRHKGTGELYFWAAFVQKAQKADGTWVHIKPKVRFVDQASGAEIDRARLVNFLPTESVSDTHGVESGREAIVRTYKLESIKALTINGVSYVPITK